MIGVDVARQACFKFKCRISGNKRGNLYQVQGQSKYIYNMF